VEAGLGLADSLVLSESIQSNLNAEKVFIAMGRHSLGAVPNLIESIELPNHRIHRRAGTLPWITAAALRQHNDTKDLNWVQRPLVSTGKLVDNPVSSFGITNWTSLGSSATRARGVDGLSALRCLSTRY
jgi:hypothetical protein